MSPITNPVILVIDTCGLDLTATAALLHDNGYDVHCAQDRTAAIKAAQEIAIDLMICDDSIDRESDQRLVDIIHDLPDRNDVSVMFSSVNQIPDVIRRTDHFGPCYHLRKPFEPEVMLELVDNALWMPESANRPVTPPHFQLPKSIQSNFSSSG